MTTVKRFETRDGIAGWFHLTCRLYLVVVALGTIGCARRIPWVQVPVVRPLVVLDELAGRAAYAAPTPSTRARAACEAVAFRPHSHEVAGAYDDHLVRLFDLTTGKVVKTFNLGRKVQCIAFSPDGTLLAAAGGNWLHPELVSEDVVTIWEVESGRIVSSLEGHTGAVGGLAFAPNGKLLASGGSDQTVRIWDLAAKRALYVLSTDPSNDGSGLRFTVDGRYVYSGNGCVWDLAQLKKGRPAFLTQSYSGWAMTVTRDDRLAISGRSFEGAYVFFPGLPPIIYVNDFPSGRVKERWDVSAYFQEIRSMALSPDGRAFLPGSTPLYLWNLHGQPIYQLGGAKLSRRVYAEFSPDGQWIAAADQDTGKITVWKNPLNGQ